MHYFNSLELWERVDDYPNYIISNTYKMKNIITNKELKAGWNGNIWYFVLYKNGIKKSLSYNKLYSKYFKVNLIDF